MQRGGMLRRGKGVDGSSGEKRHPDYSLPSGAVIRPRGSSLGENKYSV